MGEQHLEVIASRLENEYKVKIELSKPKVAYRETIRKKSDVEYKYKKQSGGHGQYGHVKMRFDPPAIWKLLMYSNRRLSAAQFRKLLPGSRKGYRRSRSERSSGSISGCRCKGCFI